MRFFLLISLLAGLGACGGSEPIVPENQGESLQSLEDQTSGSSGTEPGDQPGAKPPVVSVDPALEQRRRQAQILLKKAEKATDPFDRAEVLAQGIALGKEASPLWPLVQSSMEVEDDTLRETCVQLAVAIKGSHARAFLERALKDPADSVRVQAVISWAEVKIPDLWPIIELLDQEIDPRVQQAGMKAIAAAGDQGHLNRVREMVEILDERALVPALEFLRKNGGAAEAPIVRGMLQRDDFQLRAAAAKALEGFGDKSKETLVALCLALEDEESQVRRAAIDALKTLAGRNFGYDPEGTELSREQAVKAWREWAEKQS